MALYPDEIIKPNNLNHHRKRNWEITDLLQIGLTDCARLAILLPSINRLAGFRSLFSIGVKTPFHGVFYCPKKMATALIRAFVLVARNGQPKGWPAPIPGTANLLRVAAQQFAVAVGGYQSSVLELPL